MLAMPMAFGKTPINCLAILSGLRFAATAGLVSGFNSPLVEASLAFVIWRSRFDNGILQVG
jgi:hypothetical protein